MKNRRMMENVRGGVTQSQKTQVSLSPKSNLKGNSYGDSSNFGSQNFKEEDSELNNEAEKRPLVIEEEKKGDLREKQSVCNKASPKLQEGDVKRNDSITESNKEIKGGINIPTLKWETDLSTREEKDATWNLPKLCRLFESFPEKATQLEDDNIYEIDLSISGMKKLCDKTNKNEIPSRIAHIKINNIPCDFTPLKGLLRDCIKNEVAHLSLHWKDDVLADEYVEYIQEAVNYITGDIKLSNFKLQDYSLLAKLFNEESKDKEIELNNFRMMMKPAESKEDTLGSFFYEEVKIKLAEDASDTFDKLIMIHGEKDIKLDFHNIPIVETTNEE